MHVLGIDASTTATGIVILDDSLESKHQLLFYGATTFKKCKGFWEKCDELHRFLNEIRETELFDEVTGKRTKINVERFFIEEPMKRFSPGLSSAETISVLQRFNGITCYITRDVFGVDPTYVNVSSARKAAGIKVTTKAKSGGRNAKQQAFDHMAANDLFMIKWPTKKKSNNIVDWAKDVTDAYVVARGGMVLDKQNTPSM